MKFVALAAVPAGVVTWTGPLVAPAGTLANTKSIPELVKTANGAVTLLIRTDVAALIPVPTISSGDPIAPEGGMNPTISGSTTNGVALVADPRGVDTTI